MRTKYTITKYLLWFFSTGAAIAWAGYYWNKPAELPVRQPSALEIVESQATDCVELQKRIRKINDNATESNYLNELKPGTQSAVRKP